MNKADLVEKISSNTGESKGVIEKVLKAFMDTVVKAVKKGDAVTLIGFGTFKKISRKGRKGRNPKTGEVIKIPASKSVKFTPGKALKDKVK